MLSNKYKLGMAILVVLFVTTSASFAAPQIDFWHTNMSMQVDSRSKVNLELVSKYLDNDSNGLAWMVREFSRSHQGQAIIVSVDCHLLAAPDLTQFSTGGSAVLLPDRNNSGLACACQEASKLPSPLFVSAKEDIQPLK